MKSVGIIWRYDKIYGHIVPLCVWCVVYWGRYVVSNRLVTREKNYCDFNKGIRKINILFPAQVQVHCGG